MAYSDFRELQNRRIDETFFQKLESQRLLNSFLFGYIKLQDKMGAKLFKRVLYELGEIDTMDVAMVDILSQLEKLNILQLDEWLRLREIRNIIAHEYPLDIESRIQSAEAAMDGFMILREILQRVEDAIKKRGD